MNLGVGEILIIFFLIVMLVLITAMIGGAGLTIARRVSRANEKGQAPLDVIKLRYARGEISKEQFDAMKRELS